MKFIKKHGAYFISLAIGLVLTVLAVIAAKADRGYWAFGGEYFIIPICLMFAYAYNEYKKSRKTV